MVWAIKSIAFFFVLWLISYFYGDFSLVDNVVPEQGVSIDEWMEAYYYAGAASAVVGFVFSLIWYRIGLSYQGGSGIKGTFGILWILAAIGGFAVAFILLLNSRDGSGAALFFTWIIAPLGYYLNALMNSAPAVMYIPFLADKLHK